MKRPLLLPPILDHCCYLLPWTIAVTSYPGPLLLPPILDHCCYLLSWTIAVTSYPGPLLLPPILDHCCYLLSWTIAVTSNPGISVNFNFCYSSSTLVESFQFSSPTHPKKINK